MARIDYSNFGGSDEVSTATKVQEVASAISWNNWFVGGAAIFAALIYLWLAKANRRAVTWGLLAATLATIVVPLALGREMHFGATGWSGWWGNIPLTVGLFIIWLLPRWSDQVVAGLAAGGGMLWCIGTVYMTVKGASPPDSTPFWAFAALWLNVLLDFEATDEIKASPWFLWILKLSGFAALACM